MCVCVCVCVCVLFYHLLFFFLGEKQLKPVSGRVGEIAEFVLQCLIEKTVRILLFFLKEIAMSRCTLRAVRGWAIKGLFSALSTRRARWRVPITAATCRVWCGGWLETGDPGSS